MTDARTWALMWEAKAAEGAAGPLLAWVRAQPLHPAPARRETFTAPGGRVLVITWWHVPDGAPRPPSGLPELPDPDPALLARPVHRWSFESLAAEEPADDR